MKNLLFLLLLLPVQGLAQPPKHFPHGNASTIDSFYGTSWSRQMIAPDTSYLNPYFGSVNSWGIVNGTIYVYNGTKWNTASGGISQQGLDDTAAALRNAIATTGGITPTTLNDSLANYLPRWLADILYQPVGNYELTSNKVTSLASPNNTTYPTTAAVNTALVPYLLTATAASTYQLKGNYLRLQDSNIYASGYVSLAYYYSHLPGSASYTNGSNLLLAGNVFYADTTANHLATKTDLLALLHISDSNIYQPKYRADTARVNILAYVATKGSGTVMSITAAAPLTGGTITTSGSIGIAKATTGTDGYLGATDFTTFNNKENALTFTAPLSRSVNTISIPAATSGTAGYLTAADWTTFNSKQPAGTYVTTVTGTGNRITSTGGTTPAIDIAATYTGQTSITTLGTIGTGTWQGSSILDAYISSAATWNAKQAQLNGTGFVKASGTTITYDNSTYLTGNQTITVTATGDATGTASSPTNLTLALVLAASGVTAGTYGSATQSPVITVDTKGRVTVAGNTTIMPAFSSVTGKPTTLSGYGITDAQSSTLQNGYMWIGNASNTATAVLPSGDWTISNTGVAILKNTGTAGTYGSATLIPGITTDAQGRITSVTTYTFTSGGVTSVSGTSPIIVSGTTTPTVSITYTASATPSTVMGRDANGVTALVNLLLGYNAVTSAATTTTLTVSSAYRTLVTGSTTQTIQLPVTSTLSPGFPYNIVNKSTGYVTVTSSGGNTVQVMEPNSSGMYYPIATGGTTASDWTVQYADPFRITAATTGNSTIVLPQYTFLIGVCITPTTTTNVAIGTTLAGTDVYPTTLVTANSLTNASVGKLFSRTGTTTLYITCSGTYTIDFFKKQ